MSEIRCIIVEDEPLAVKVLTDYISEIPFLDLRGIFKDAILASDFLRDHKVDLIFLDMHLPRLKGMDFLKTLTNPPAVIVTTAYHQYAIEGFNLNVTDYLLKPFGFERFLVAINKVRSAAAASGIPAGSEFRKHIIVSVQKKKVKILLDEILFIESQREYVKIVTPGNEYLSKMSTHEIEALLPLNRFRRVHRSFIISIDKIESFTSSVIEVNGIPIPIGRGYKNVLDDM
jgi:two-component system, LytTR family, response regulator